MKLDQKLTFSTKNYQYVASPSDANISDTVLLFEPRMRHPALRVIFVYKYLKFLYFCFKVCEKIEKIDFFKIFNFVIFFGLRCANFFRIFTLAITYRPEMLIAQIDRLNELSPKMK